MLHQGEKLKLNCPAYLSNGGAEIYSNVDDGFKVPQNTPLTFEMEVMNCKASTDLENFNKANTDYNVSPMKKGMKFG